MRFQDAVPDGRSVVYAGVQADPLVGRMARLLADATGPQRILARAVMNGESTDPAHWRAMFPTIFATTDDGADRDPRSSEHGEAVLATALEVADHGDQARNQLRGAIVEALTEALLSRRVDPALVRRERRILFDGVAAEIHPYDVTVEHPGGAEAYDCKWGARGINADVLHQLDDARRHAADDDEELKVGLVVFDAERSCLVRLERQTAPADQTQLIALERLDGLAVARPRP